MNHDHSPSDHTNHADPKDCVRADLVDYRDLGKKGRPFLAIDTWPTLEKAVEDFSASGWEENADVLMQNCCLVADRKTGRILATGTYIKSKESDMPALIWVFTETGQTVTRFYEIEYSEFIKQCRKKDLPKSVDERKSEGGTDDRSDRN